MALKESVVDGDKQLVSDDLLDELRQIEIFSQPANEEEDPELIGVAVRNIVTIRQIHEWYALTLDAAKDYVQSADPPAEGTYSYTITRDQREISSHTLRREFTREITGPVLNLDPCDNPTFDPPGGLYPTEDPLDETPFWPLSVVIESETENAKIRYAILEDGVLSSWVDINSGDAIVLTEPSTGELTVFALAFRAGRLPSDIVSATYTAPEEEEEE
jgi:hypothetical protein